MARHVQPALPRSPFPDEHRMNRIAFFLVGFYLLSTGPVLAQEALFPDPGLEAAVRAQVFAKRNNQEPLTAEDVANISQVRGIDRKISSLSGLEHCKSIQMLELGKNEITDLSPLSELKLLQSLSLNDNKIESIQPLKDLERLQLLDLSGNLVKDIGPLAKMTNLRTLYLSNNQIEEIQVLGELPKIWTLYLSGNAVKDWSPVGKLGRLTSLNLSGCKIQDLAFLKPLQRLSTVILHDNEIKDLAPLIEMAEADESRQFAPYWRIYLRGNGLDGSSEQVAKLKSLGAKISFE